MKNKTGDLVVWVGDHYRMTKNKIYVVTRTSVNRQGFDCTWVITDDGKEDGWVDFANVFVNVSELLRE